MQAERDGGRTRGRRIGLVALAIGLALAAGAPVRMTARAGHWVVVHTWPPVPSSVTWGQPSAVAVDQQGDLIILQRGTPPLLEFAPDGRMIRAWGAGFFKNPHGMKIDPRGNIWVTDSVRNIIVEYSPAGKRLRVIGTPDEAGTGPDHFGGVTDLAFAPNGDFYVADGYQNARIMKFDGHGRFLFQWGRPGSGPGEFHLPHAIAVDSHGRVYVADRENSRIQVFTGAGKYITQWHGVKPFGLAMTKDDKLWVADTQANRMVEFNLAGKVVDAFTPSDPKPGTLMGPHMVAIGPDGALYLAETRRMTVREFRKE